MGGIGIKWASLEQMRAFADSFIDDRPRGGIVALSGDLGAGKTSFVRACVERIAKQAGLPIPRVASPSFVIHQHYGLGCDVDHFDLYRLEALGEEQLTEIGYPEAVERAQSGGFLFVEWPENVTDKSLLKADEWLTIEIVDGARLVRLE